MRAGNAPSSWGARSDLEREPMGLTHMRKPKNFVLEERLERYAAAIEQRPEALAGRWAEACFPGIGAPAQAAAEPPSLPRFERVHLDLGCGKGTFLVESARRNPETLYLGMDFEPVCIAYAAQRIIEEGLANALVIPRGAGALPRLFGAGELAEITLNFPTPYPKRRYADRRLTSVDHLLGYRRLFAPEGRVVLRTDSQPLRDFSLGQFEAAGYRLSWVSDDVRAEHPGFPATEYEQRLADRGARVYGICATPGEAPSDEQIARGRAVEQSLMAYLPDDLESLAYVPLGMEAAVTNLINRRRHEALRARQAR